MAASGFSVADEMMVMFVDFIIPAAMVFMLLMMARLMAMLFNAAYLCFSRTQVHMQASGL